MTSPTAMAAPHISLSEQKQAARVQARATLERCGSGGRRVALRLWQRIPPATIVGGFYPKGQEVDAVVFLREFWSTAAGPECVVALPCTPARGLPLTFRRWMGTDALVIERFGTMTSDGPHVEPDILLVPLLAFDRRGHRLGYGGGYYDRTLAARPHVWTIGCAYAAQEVPAVPTGPFDMPLHAVATEAEFIEVRPHPLGFTRPHPGPLPPAGEGE